MSSYIEHITFDTPSKVGGLFRNFTNSLPGGELDEMREKCVHKLVDYDNDHPGTMRLTKILPNEWNPVPSVVGGESVPLLPAKSATATWAKWNDKDKPETPQIPDGWFREAIPSEYAPDAVRFSKTNRENEPAFMYACIPSRGVLIVSALCPMLPMILFAYQESGPRKRCPSVNLPYTHASEKSRLGKRFSGEAMSDIEFDNLFVFSVNRCSSGGIGVITLASLTPYALSYSHSVNTLASSLLGFAEAVAVPSAVAGGGRLFIEFMAVSRPKFNENSSEVFDAVFSTFPADSFPVVFFRLGFGKGVYKEREADWANIVINDQKFSHPRIAYTSESCGEIPVGIDVSIERTCASRLVSGSCINGLKDATLGIYFAIREVSRMLITTKGTGNPSFQTVSRKSREWLYTESNIRKKGVEIRGSFTSDPRSQFTTVSQDGVTVVHNDTVDEPRDFKKISRVYITKRPVIEPASRRKFAVKASLDADDLTDVAECAGLSLYSLTIATPYGIASVKPTGTFALFSTFLRSILRVSGCIRGNADAVLAVIGEGTFHVCRKHIQEMKTTDYSSSGIEHSPCIKSLNAITIENIVKESEAFSSALDVKSVRGAIASFSYLFSMPSKFELFDVSWSSWGDASREFKQVYA